MIVAKKLACIFAGCALCALMLWGCSEDQGNKVGEKTVTAQEKVGKEAAATIKKPVDEARKAAAKVEAKANKVLNDEEKKTVRKEGLEPDQAGAKEKKKLEGC